MTNRIYKPKVRQRPHPTFTCSCGNKADLIWKDTGYVCKDCYKKYLLNEQDNPND